VQFVEVGELYFWLPVVAGHFFKGVPDAGCNLEGMVPRGSLAMTTNIVWEVFLESCWVANCKQPVFPFQIYGASNWLASWGLQCDNLGMMSNTRVEGGQLVPKSMPPRQKQLFMAILLIMFMGGRPPAAQTV
jgi:hypothetical protein